MPGQGLCNCGLSREGYANASKLNTIVRGAFAAVQLLQYTPHAFHKTLTKYGDEISSTMEQRKACSMNLVMKVWPSRLIPICL